MATIAHHIPLTIAHEVLPAPVLFHPLKHHAGYIRAFIQEQARQTIGNPGKALQRIGASQLDLYTGPLTPLQLAEEVISYLQQRGLLHPETYQRFLAAHSGNYHMITLPDATGWVLRWGNTTDRHVHVHPARYALQTIRVKAASLKTAIAAIVAARQQQQPISLPLINNVRLNWLNLPPLTDFTTTAGAGKLITLLQQQA